MLQIGEAHKAIPTTLALERGERGSERERKRKRRKGEKGQIPTFPSLSFSTLL
jgi:hypothetical protein